jgi:hypothetical protein
MSNYPPGVTGNEPQITGEWPCGRCQGEKGERDPDGGSNHYVCERCLGTGIEPEEFTDEQYRSAAVSEHMVDGDEASKANEMLIAQLSDSRDDVPVVDRVTDGAWVRAWLWVADDDV